MSEEILKALMQLFAIITKQDDGVSEKERSYVQNFLTQQLNSELVSEYMSLYDSFSKTDEVQSVNTEEVKKKKLTNVKDSVRTLSICKKINKTLTQKQKVIVLIRLFELIKSEQSLPDQKIQIIDTVSTVFNIQSDEFKIIEKFVTENSLEASLDIPELLLVGDYFEHITENLKKIHAHGFDGKIAILKVKSVEMYFLRYLGQSDVVLNGLPVNIGQIYLMASGSTIKLPIGDPLYYSDIVSKFLSDLQIQKVCFEVKDIHYQFPNGTIGLRGVSFSEGPGKLIGIMGGSGAGKTTLLNVLAGLEQPSNGHVIINGFDVHKDRHEMEGVIGYVAQDDILFEELTVFQNLYYNAKLCLSHLSEVELQKLVLQILKNLGLAEIRDVKVGNVLNKKISGGQRKRLNIALELIREPSVMFLDEPTSGLSSRDSENVMDLLKELSLKGKLIFVVIHQPSSDIYKMFDKIFILDVGGYPVYYGNSVQAVIYFKTLTNQINSNVGQCVACGNVNPEQIFNY
jgi:ABC transport system ATP-binding/permease protein